MEVSSLEVPGPCIFKGGVLDHCMYGSCTLLLEYLILHGMYDNVLLLGDIIVMYMSPMLN